MSEYTIPDNELFKITESCVSEHLCTKVWPKQKTALITGITGQDASYLAEFLLEKDYKVVGVKRRTSAPNYENINGILTNPNFQVVTGDITDYVSVSGLITEHKPDEIYNLAAQSFVKASFDQPIHTFDVDCLGVLNLLESIRQSDRKDEIRFYQASTSEMFGKQFDERTYSTINPDCKENYIRPIDKHLVDEKIGVRKKNESLYNTFSLAGDGLGFWAPEKQPYILHTEKYQDEETPFVPQSPYGIAKLAAHHLVRLYRDSYKIKAACGILFNHESPRRGIEFVTRKITDYVGRLEVAMETKAEYDSLDNFPKLKLGNLDAVRDWGHAKDFVEAQWLILQQKHPSDFVICTGESHSVREFCELAFNEIGVNYKDWVEVDPAFYRPAEVDHLHGDATKAYRQLGWKPKHTFAQLVAEMVQEDIRRHSK